MTDFSPLRPIDGYLPLEDHGLIGDGSTAALVGRDGAVTWLCVPRFDSDPLFCGLLDRQRGGFFRIAPEDLVESRQRYEPDTGVLITELRGTTGVVRVTDALTLRTGADLREDAPASRRELLRQVQILEGRVRLRIELEPRGGADLEPRGAGWRLRCPRHPDLDLQFESDRPLQGLRSVLDLNAGDDLWLLLEWGGRPHRHRPVPPPEILKGTVRIWRQWMEGFVYQGPREALVRRSALTLKMLDHFANGALVAAPTSSVPEVIGGERNWDYRYSWVRDAAFSVYALHRIGLSPEAAGFLAWVFESIERDGRPRVLYDVEGRMPPPERTDPDLQGYRGSAPVRWGNAAADQVQHDVYGEILDCAYQWAGNHGGIDASLWRCLSGMVEDAALKWRTPDQGIWEVRTAGRAFTYSAALCQVALDRGARLVERLGLPGDARRWKATAEEIRQAILEESWDPQVNSLTEHLGGGGIDASLLSLPLRRVIPGDHPRMIATTEAVRSRLGAGNGLIYRYLVEESPDGLAGREGAFLLCSFWLVDNLGLQGRLDEAGELYDSLCARASPLGLLPEQIDPSTGAFLGNFPQAFSHVGLISSGFNLGRRLARKT